MASLRRAAHLTANSAFCLTKFRAFNAQTYLNSISQISKVEYRLISQLVKPNGIRSCPPFDTLALVRNLEAQGVPTKQAEALTAAITEVLNDSLENISHNFVSNAEMQKIRMLLESHFSKFESQVQSSGENEKLRNDLEKLRIELRYEIDKVNTGQRLDLNLERGRIGDELANQNAETTNLTSKLDKEINAVGARLEAAKVDVIKYCVLRREETSWSIVWKIGEKCEDSFVIKEKLTATYRYRSPIGILSMDRYIIAGHSMASHYHPLHHSILRHQFLALNHMAARAISASATADAVATTVSTRNTNPVNSRHVAVIGAGAAGLVAAHELRREGHHVVVYERQSRIGGTWVYTPETEPDPLGIDPNRPIVHSSLYRSLRTNLPREVMGFREYPFVPSSDPKRDPRRFPGHQEVLDYLRDYATEFRIEEMVRFEREVVSVGLVDTDDYSRWRVKSMNHQEEEEEEFDAVVVCNGHYTEPRVADIPGIDTWPGKQMHSHNYRVPDPFKDQVVILIGSAASAVDISRDIAAVAKEVHVAIRSSEGASLGMQPGYTNLWLHPMIKSVHGDGAIVFVDGTSTYADTVLHCTGYKYHFPFLETQGIVNVEDNRVGPLYQHVFPPVLAPWLSFIGLTWKVVPFPQFEFQSKWIAGALSGKIALPSQKEMMDDIEMFYANLEAAGVPKRYTHNQSKTQFEYNNWLAEQCGIPAFEEWKIEIYKAASKNKVINPETYRDKWEDDDLIHKAYKDIAQYISHVNKDQTFSMF